jgi:hypothetical protein
MNQRQRSKHGTGYCITRAVVAEATRGLRRRQPARRRAELLHHDARRWLRAGSRHHSDS